MAEQHFEPVTVLVHSEVLSLGQPKPRDVTEALAFLKVYGQPEVPVDAVSQTPKLRQASASSTSLHLLQKKMGEEAAW